MTHLLMVIVHDLERLPDLLRAWQRIGVPGGTILRSTGGDQATSWLRRMGLGALDGLFESHELAQRTLFVAIGDEQLLSAAIGEAERVMGGFDRPHSGLLLVLPVAEVKGLRKVQAGLPQQTLPPVIQPDWILRRDTPIAEVLENLNLEPTVVRPDTPLDEVAQAMLLHPNVHVVCIVEEESRLVGILDLRTLADDLFFHILPEEFLSEITDLEHVMEFAELSQIRSAGDAMSEPVWVKPEETVKDAFIRMHEHKLPGLPVVDERYRVVGYINLLTLLSSCLEC